MARGKRPARRRRTPALEGGRAVVVATRPDIAAALAGDAQVLVTAPGMAHAAGPAWYTAVLRRLMPENPPPLVFDVGDDAALGHHVLTNGGAILFTGSQRYHTTLAETFPGRVFRGVARSGRLR
jgi:hypothetical protein